MIYIHKLSPVPAKFLAIVAEFGSYQELNANSNERDDIKRILLNEQGCLCPYCEKRLDVRSATIEHFQPQSTFPNLQLAYSNLYACCPKCNGNKTNHLIPAYIFDSRIDCFNNESLIKDRSADFRLYFNPVGVYDIILEIPNYLTKSPKDSNQFHADSILYSTIELLDLNNKTRLLEHRREVYDAIIEEIVNNNNIEWLKNKYFSLKSMTKNGDCWQYEEYISMKLFLLAEKIKRKNGLNEI